MFRSGLMALAITCFIAALLLINAAGLPSRANFTGAVYDHDLVAPEVGAIAPPFEAETASGGKVALADLRGAPVILNFWATWCGPCRLEMPELQALYEAERSRGLRIVGVNVGEARQDVLDWMDNYGLTFDVALDPLGEIAARYLLRGQPTTVVLAPDGRILEIVYGPATQPQLRAILEPYL